MNEHTHLRNIEAIKNKFHQTGFSETFDVSWKVYPAIQLLLKYKTYPANWK